MKIILCPNPFRDKGLKAARSTERLLSAAGVHTEYCFPFPVEKSNIGEIDPAIKIKEMKTELPDADFLVCFGGDGTILHLAKTLAMNRETYRRYPPEQNWLSDLIQTLLVDEMFRRRCRRRNCRKWSQKT